MTKEDKGLKGITIKDYKDVETVNGLLYAGTLLLDGRVVGSFNNAGSGEFTTHEIVTEERGEFISRLYSYFGELNWDMSDVPDSSIINTFIEHLVDVHQLGKVNSEWYELGFVR